MISIAGGKLGIAATIATRYSCVRQQGFFKGTSEASYQAPERQIIDYQVLFARSVQANMVVPDQKALVCRLVPTISSSQACRWRVRHQIDGDLDQQSL